MTHADIETVAQAAVAATLIITAGVVLISWIKAYYFENEDDE